MDRAASKDFGAIGSPVDDNGTTARGIKVISAIRVDPQGVPLGMTAMTYWTRQGVQQKPSRQRKLEDKETKHWIATIDQAVTHMASVADETKCWFQVDREGIPSSSSSIWRDAGTCTRYAEPGIERCATKLEGAGMFTICWREKRLWERTRCAYLKDLAGARGERG